VTTIFGTDTPVQTDNNNGAPGITVGTRIRANVAGNITEVRWYSSATPPANAQWILVRYVPGSDGPGAAIGSGNFTNPITGGAWNTVAVGPFALSAGDEFVVEEWNSEGRYASTQTYFNADVNRGDITGPANDNAFPRHNGRFNVGGAIAFPTDGFNASGYFIDVTFVANNSGATINALTVVGTTSIATPTVRGGATTSGLATVAGTTSIPVPTVAAGAGINPATVAGVTTIPTPTVRGGATITPATVQCRAIIPTPIVNPVAGSTGPIISVGAPRTRWTVGSPRTRWRVG
jgi:hypothetical protein